MTMFSPRSNDQTYGLSPISLQEQMDFTPQQQHEIIMNTLTELKKEIDTFHQYKANKNECITGDVLLQTPMVWYMKYKWSRQEIETLFYKARVIIDEKFDSSLKETFGGSPGPRWKGKYDRKQVEYDEDIFQIFVECADGTIETLNVQSNHTLNDIKYQIESITKESKYCFDEQRLYSNGKLLRFGKKTLRQLNICKNDTLQLCAGKMSIFVETMQGKNIHIFVKPDEKLIELKKILQLPNEHFLINQLNGNKLCNDEKMLFIDYGIIQNSQLIVEGKINVKIEKNDGQSIELSVNPKSKIKEIKKEIAIKVNIPTKQQMLCLNDEELDDDDALITYKMDKNDIIKVKKMVNITIKISDLNRMELEICASDKLICIKQSIRKNTFPHIMINTQHLMFKGNELMDNERMIDEYGITQDCEITLLQIKEPEPMGSTINKSPKPKRSASMQPIHSWKKPELIQKNVTMNDLDTNDQIKAIEKSKKRTKKKRRKRISAIQPVPNSEYIDFFGDLNESKVIIGAVSTTKKEKPKQTVTSAVNMDKNNNLNLLTKDNYDELFDVGDINPSQMSELNELDSMNELDHISNSENENEESKTMDILNDIASRSKKKKKKKVNPFKFDMSSMKTMKNRFPSKKSIDANPYLDEEFLSTHDDDIENDVEVHQIAKPLLDIAMRNKIAKAMRKDRKQKKRERRSRYGRMQRMGSISETEVSDFEQVDNTLDVAPDMDISPFSSRSNSPQPPALSETEQLPSEQEIKKRKRRKRKQRKERFEYQSQSDHDDEELTSRKNIQNDDEIYSDHLHPEQSKEKKRRKSKERHDDDDINGDEETVNSNDEQFREKMKRRKSKRKSKEKDLKEHGDDAGDAEIVNSNDEQFREKMKRRKSKRKSRKKRKDKQASQKSIDMNPYIDEEYIYRPEMEDNADVTHESEKRKRRKKKSKKKRKSKRKSRKHRIQKSDDLDHEDDDKMRFPKNYKHSHPSVASRQSIDRNPYVDSEFILQSQETENEILNVIDMHSPIVQVPDEQLLSPEIDPRLKKRSYDELFGDATQTNNKSRPEKKIEEENNSVLDISMIESIVNDMSTYPKDTRRNGISDSSDNDDKKEDDHDEFEHDETMKQMLEEIKMDEENEEEKIAFDQHQKRHFDDLMDGFFTEEDMKIDDDMNKMSLMKLLKRYRLDSNESLYKYYHDTLHIEFAEDMTNHLPISITRPKHIKSTQVLMFISRMSIYISQKVKDGQFNGLKSKEWVELETNSFSNKYGRPSLAHTNSKIYRPLYTLMKNSLHFEDNEGSNELKIDGKEYRFVDHIIDGGNMNNFIANVIINKLPETDEKEHNSLFVGVSFYDENEEEVESIYISNRTELYQNDTFLEQFDNWMDDDSEVVIRINNDNEDEISVKFEHLSDGQLHSHNEQTFSFDASLYCYMKIFVEQIHGEGMYSVYKAIPESN